MSQWTYWGNSRGERRVREVREGESEVERERKGKERRKEGDSSPLLIHSDQPGTYSLLPFHIHTDPLQEVSPLLPWAFVLAEWRIFCQRLETVTFTSQKALGDNLGCMEGTRVSSAQKHHRKGGRRENTGFVMSASLSSLGCASQAGGASGRIERWGKPAINQLCLH